MKKLIWENCLMLEWKLKTFYINILPTKLSKIQSVRQKKKKKITKQDGDSKIKAFFTPPPKMSVY